MATKQPLLVAGLLVLSVLSIGPVASTGATTDTATTAIDSCRVIDDPGRYELTQDLQVDDGLQSYCLKITASDVTLDGNGHTVEGNYTRQKDYRANDALAATSNGVLVDGNGTLSNVTVQDLTLTDWKVGVHTRDTTGSRLAAITVQNARHTGLEMEGFDSGQVVNVTATETYGPAIEFGGDDTVLRGNDFSGNDVMSSSFSGTGLYASGSNLTLVDNRVVNNYYAGMVAGQHVVLRNNTLSNNHQLGVEATDVTIAENRVFKTNSYFESGLGIDGSNVTIEDNRFEDEDVGVAVNGSEFRIVGNTFEHGGISTPQGIENGLVDATIADNSIQNGSIGVGAPIVDGAPVEDAAITVADNDIENGGILVEAAPETTIRNNTIAGEDGQVLPAGVLTIGRANGTLIVENTVTGHTDGVRLETARSVAIRRNVIRNNTDGIHITNQSETSYSDDDCTLQVAETNVSATIHENTIAGNAEYGIHNEDAGTVNATRNYWGASDGPSSASSASDSPLEDSETGTLADGSGDAVSEGPTAGVSNVHFDESLDEPPV